ncbi:MAG: FAD-dependent oxidoreductase [Chitinispirillaceae bacterium]|nr:FAD-dependent oxidoreductase [Chitinispirillaceae bacterium]
MANPVKIPGTVASIQAHDQGVYTLVIAPEKRVPRFRAGQFLHLTIDDFDPQGGFWPESRVFSIASAPTNGNVEIVYSVKGRYTSRMSAELAPGKRVWIKLPYGDFSIETAAPEGRPLLLVAGGTGVSPYMSYLQSALSGGVVDGRQIHLVYGIRKPEHVLYPEVLSACCLSFAGFGMDLFIENGTCDALAGIPQKNGMITLDHILMRGKAMGDPVYFLSGPPVMIKTFKVGLLAAGIGETNIKIDEWE